MSLRGVALACLPVWFGSATTKRQQLQLSKCATVKQKRATFERCKLCLEQQKATYLGHLFSLATAATRSAIKIQMPTAVAERRVSLSLLSCTLL